MHIDRVGLEGARKPRLIHEEILDRPAFRGGLAALSAQEGQSEAALARRASRYLGEIVVKQGSRNVNANDALVRAGHAEYVEY